MENHPKRQKKTEVLSSQNAELPLEIIYAILSRLPVKPLCRFKLVSKSWQSLISGPDFVANYYKASTENNDVFFSRRRLYFTTMYGPESRVYSLNLDKFLNENAHNIDASVTLEAVPTELDIVRSNHLVPETGWQYSRPIVHGSSRLFLSQSYSGDFCYSLINPVTKESKELPKVPFWRLPLEPFNYSIYGFGLDYSSNDYKVINGQEYADGVVFSVYTLQTDSWRQIDLFPYLVLDYDGILVNGAVHWLVREVEEGSMVILSFNLAEEKVREIAVPPTATTNSRLGAFRNWLSITSISVSASETCSEFWFMKKYGASDSWTEMRVSKPYKELSHSGFWTETHDLMVFDFSSLVMYNFNDDTFWNLSIRFGRSMFTREKKKKKQKKKKNLSISSIGIYVETPTNLNSSIKNNKFQGR